MLYTALADATAEQALPIEFVLFRAGANLSTKGPAVFDVRAAADVMAAYACEGVDQSIDLEHRSLDDAAVALTDNATDSLGWYNLEVRPGPELWAVNVRWTPEGEARLRAKKQRYISPAFYQNDRTTRVTKMINCALCSRPATYNADALMAATKRNDVRAARARAFDFMRAASKASQNGRK